MTKKDMQSGNPPGENTTPRSLETLRRDLSAYRADGSRPNNMKKFNNVVDEPILNIPLDQVCYLDMNAFSNVLRCEKMFDKRHVYFRHSAFLHRSAYLDYILVLGCS